MRVSGNQRLLIRGHDTAGLFTIYPVWTACANSFWQGQQIDPGRIVVNGPDAEVDHYSSRNSDAIAISLKPEILREAARALRGLEDVDLPKTWASMSPSPAAFNVLNQRLSRLLEAGLADPMFLQSNEGERWEQDCIHAIVATLFECPTSRTLGTLPTRSRILRQAEAIMHSHLEKPWGAVELSHELGVSNRTLRLAFQERYDLGPMAYYRSLQLNEVRLRLQTSGTHSVADIARACGFHHLGNFAAHYRRLFGEVPSETQAAS